MLLTKQNMVKGQSSPRPERKVIWCAEKWPSMQFLVQKHDSSLIFRGQPAALLAHEWQLSHTRPWRMRKCFPMILQAVQCKCATWAFGLGWWTVMADSHHRFSPALMEVFFSHYVWLFANMAHIDQLGQYFHTLWFICNYIELHLRFDHITPSINLKKARTYSKFYIAVGKHSCKIASALNCDLKWFSL